MRFIDRPKEVNQQWAINLINEVPPQQTEDRIVCCNGGGGPLGHPKVYINLVNTLLQIKHLKYLVSLFFFLLINK